MTIAREYFNVQELSKYSGISERTLWDLLKSPANPIPYFRIGATGRIVRVKKSEFDAWMQIQKASNINEIDRIVDEVLG